MEMLREQSQQLQLLEVEQIECDRLFTNRLLWLSASAGALLLGGLRLPQPRPPGVFDYRVRRLREKGLPGNVPAEVKARRDVDETLLRTQVSRKGGYCRSKMACLRQVRFRGRAPKTYCC
jgi:hypothetical protein